MKISKLVDALRNYAIKSAREYFEERLADSYRAPRLASWDSLAWFELVRDWELVDFLVSDSPEAGRLMRSLQSLLQWYGQAETDDILERMALLSRIN